jgi:hypothetical protein
MPRTHNTPNSSDFELVRRKAVIIGLVLVGISILVFVGAEKYLLAYPFWKEVLKALAMALLPIGAVALIYELQLRREVGSELLRLTGLQGSVAQNRVSNVGSTSDIDWTSTLSASSQFVLVLADPAAWVDLHWSRILSAATDRVVQVDVLFPNPDGASLTAIAGYHGLSGEALRGSILRAKQSIEDSWKQLALGANRKKGSKIRIAYFDGMPAYNLVRIDGKIVMMLHACTKREPADNGFYVAFDGRHDDYPLSWFRGELDKLKQNAAVYEHVIA